MKKYFILSVLFILFMFRCTSDRIRYKAIVDEKVSDLLKKAQTSSFLQNERIKKSPSKHFNLRKPQYVIIHQTIQNNCKKTLQLFYNPHSNVSAHYVICKDGTIVQVIDDYLRAWHAGVGKWGNIIDMNSVSLGIELDNSGYEAFPWVQIKSLMNLLRGFRKKYKIPPTNIIGHGDIAPSRKEDPHCQFPWKVLADHGLAVMPDRNLPKKVSGHFDYLKALRLIGYDITNPKDAIEAFRRHYIGCNASNTELLTTEELIALENVASKY